jgi:mannan endo-1,4-beta-mannosidase
VIRSGAALLCHRLGSMKSRAALVLAIVFGCVALAIVAVRLAPRSSGAGAAYARLPASPASYLGVYEADAPGSYRSIMAFGRVAGRQPGLAGYYSGWPEPFKIAFARLARNHGAVPLVQLDPTGASVAAIAAGRYDPYLRAFADAVRHFRSAVVIGFGHEMNASWYSWGYRHVPPRTFVAAWRHIVTLFRRQGADNVTWLWTIQADIRGSGPIENWWPGSGYVTWVGIDGYYYRPEDTFASVFGKTIAAVRSLTRRPVLLSETAVGPRAGQRAKIWDLFQGMAEYQTLGVVWFDIAQHGGIYHQDWRIENSPAAEVALRRAVRRYLTG